MKKILILTLAALTMSSGARAADGDVFTVNIGDSSVPKNIECKVISDADRTVEVSTCDKMIEGDLVIPETVTDGSTEYTVVGIGNSSFSSAKSITSVEIPNTVVYLGSWSFSSCESLASITIPNSVTTIGYFAFQNTALTEITIPESVTSIGAWAFTDC